METKTIHTTGEILFGKHVWYMIAKLDAYFSVWNQSVELMMIIRNLSIWTETWLESFFYWRIEYDYSEKYPCEL